MSTTVSPTPELERFARDCVLGGRYSNVSDVVRSALRLLQESEERRQAFGQMIGAAEAESDRLGDAALDDVLAETDAIIATARH